MPTGTRSRISPNSATKPSAAAALALIASASFHSLGDRFEVELFGVENEPPGAHSNEDDGRYITGPGDGEERPCRQMKIVCQDMVGPRRAHFVKQHRRLDGHDK